MRLPPPWFRRPVLGGMVLVVTVALFAALPLWSVVAAFASRHVPGRWRPIRLLWFLLVWLTLESLVLLALAGLWIVSGFGWKIRSAAFSDMHYGLMGWFLRRVVGSARATFGLEFAVEADGNLSPADRPMIVMARHAGPGDSLMLVHAVLNRLGRRPRIVLKDTLQWDPAIDTLLGRLPSRFVGTGRRAGQEAIDAIGQLSGSMGAGDALVIFPEGGNFTPGRRERAISKLRDAGLEEFADRAATMPHLLPPKPGGVVAAVSAAPRSLVVLVGHTGMEDMDSVRDVWDGLEMDRMVHTRVWVHPAEDLPEAAPELGTWLYDRWHDMNAWLDDHRSPIPPTPSGSALADPDAHHPRPGDPVENDQPGLGP